MTELNIYFGILLFLAALAVGGLAIVTCLQVFRLRNKRMSWRAGTLKGFPLFSTLFLLVSLILCGVVVNTGGNTEIAASLFYVMISCSWFISSYFSSKHYITDYGIVKNINDPAQTVAWHQIHDFFEKKDRNSRRYVFIYRQEDNKLYNRLIRIELVVPAAKNQQFKKLISYKLGRRISCYEEEPIDLNQFEL